MTPAAPRQYTAREIVLMLAASATLADHMGDMWDDILYALKMVGVEINRESESQFARELHKLGATTVYGTPIGGEDED